ncbi:MAG TPA: GumC family protein [Steroidobacteraceae bacterium]|nr:GumC family protein [Steroidobacteraceae bacterium]
MKTYQRQLPHLTDAPAPAPEASLEQEPASGLSVQQIYTIVRHYWKLSATIAAALFVVLAVVIKLMPKSYTATATLIVNTPHDNPLPNGQSGNDLADYVATQAELIASPAVLVPVVDRLHLAQDPSLRGGSGGQSAAALRAYAARNLAQSLQVEEGRGGQLLQIEVSTGNPDQSALIANTISDVYLLEDRQRANDPVSQQAQLSSQELDQLRAKVVAAQAQVTAFREAHGLASIGSDATDAENVSLQNLQTRLQDAQNQRRSLEAQQAGQIDSGNEALTSPRVGALRTQLADLQGKLAALRPTLGPRHPEILSLEAQVTATQREMRDAIGTLSSNIGTQLSRTQALESELTQAVAAQQTKVMQLRQVQDQGSKLALELQSAQSVYKQALDGFEQVKFDTAQNFANVSLVNRATAPIEPSKPKKMQLLALAFLASLAGGVALPFLYELWIDRRVRCRDDLERGLGIRVLAQMNHPLLTSEHV